MVIIRDERDESRRKAKPLELERQARCKRRATAASRRNARSHLLGRAPRAAASTRPQRAPLLCLLFVALWQFGDQTRVDMDLALRRALSDVSECLGQGRIGYFWPGPDR